MGTDGIPRDWQDWTPRPMLKPEMSVVTRDGQSMLSLQAKRFASYGLWVAVVPNITPGNYYRFQVLSQARQAASPELSVMTLLRWGDAADGGRILLPSGSALGADLTLADGTRHVVDFKDIDGYKSC